VRKEEGTEGNETPSAREASTFISAVDEATKRLLIEAISSHEEFSDKKWRNMTPYERAKVM